MNCPLCDHYPGHTPECSKYVEPDRDGAGRIVPCAVHSWECIPGRRDYQCGVCGAWDSAPQPEEPCPECGLVNCECRWGPPPQPEEPRTITFPIRPTEIEVGERMCDHTTRTPVLSVDSRVVWYECDGCGDRSQGFGVD